MIPKGMFTQIIMIIIAVSIVITYVKPALADITKAQDDIVTYKKERETVISVNSKLSEMVSKLDKNVSNGDQRKLLTYLPNEIDKITVSKDIFEISQQSGVLYKDLSFEEESEIDDRNGEGSKVYPTATGFNLSVEGSYLQIKNLFSLMAKNNYPLEVMTVNISSSEGSLLSVEMQFMVYSYYNFDDSIN